MREIQIIQFFASIICQFSALFDRQTIDEKSAENYPNF